MPADFDWRGDALIKRMKMATAYGINKTMSQAVMQAKETHPFTNRTGTAERSIRIVSPAQHESSGHTTGFWGSAAVKYFWYLEMGTRFTQTRTSIIGRQKLMFRIAKSRRRVRRLKTKELPPWRGGSWAPTLRPVAERIHPMLGRNIKRGWELSR